MAKAILLVRVSTYVQDFEGQKNDLINYAKSLGYEDESQIIIANKESAIKLSDEEREGLSEMYRLLEEDTEREINAVFVWEVSRIGRQGETLDRLKNYLISRRTQLYVMKPTIQLLNADGTVNFIAKIMFELLGTLAQQEMLLKVERLMRTRKQNAANGKVSSGKALFGYIKGANGKVEKDEGGTADTVRTIFQMYAEGESLLKIYDTLAIRGELEKREELEKNDNKKLKKLKQDTIKRIVSNPSYCGRTRDNVTIKSGKYQGKKCGGTTTKYPAIISEELFDKVAQKRHERLKGEKKDTNNVYFGKGIIRYNDGHRTEAMCARRSTIDYYGNRTHQSININVMDSILWDEAKKAKLMAMNTNTKEHKEELEKMVLEMSKKIATAHKLVMKHKRGIDHANNLLIEEKMTKDAYDLKYDELSKKIAIEEQSIPKYEEQKAAFQRQLENATNGGENSTMADVEALGSNDDEKYHIIHEMITKVVVSKCGDNKIIKLFNGDIEYKNSYIYTKRGNQTSLSVKRGDTITPLDYDAFVVKRIERKAYPKKEK